jgi:hypothetical protein
MESVMKILTGRSSTRENDKKSLLAEANMESGH